MNKEKNILIFQPILTVLLLILIFFLLSSKSHLNLNVNGTLRILNDEVDFSEVVNNFLNKNYEVLTRGTIYSRVKSKDQNSSEEGYLMIGNEYDDFFILEKGNLKRINSKTDQFDISIFYNQSGSIVVLDHIQKKYFNYDSYNNNYDNKEDNYSDRDKLNKLVKYFFDNEIFPLISLVKDFKEKKFNPIKKSSNVFVSQWRHPTFTSNDICEVTVALEPSNKTFKSIAFSNTIPPSVLYFDFREISDLNENLYKIPEDYLKSQ